ncbi:MAG: PilZ domain-containing protein [Deltaproteobacteria bacterium]
MPPSSVSSGQRDDERREHHRHSCLIEVQGLHGERFFAGRAHNLSASGAFVECDTCPPRGEQVQLLFDMPPRLYRLVGSVITAREDAPRGFGVLFQTEEDKVRAVARALAGEAREVMRRPVLRAHLRLPCEVRLLCATGERVLEMQANDVSPVGAFLITEERLPAGTFLTVRFRSGSTTHDAPAVVRWCRDAHGAARPAGLGVAFLREEVALFEAVRAQGPK